MLFVPHSHIDEKKEHRATVCEKFSGMVEISHPPYSPDLNPANVFTITKVKVTFKGRFQDSEDVKNITTKRSVL